MKYFIVVNSLLFSFISFAQTKKPAKQEVILEPAYVITLKGDTLSGNLKLSRLQKFEHFEKITFIDDKTKKPRPYLPHKIKEYQLKNYQYISAYHNSKPVFFKVLSKGDLTLYVYYTEVFDEGNPIEIHDYVVEIKNASKDQFVLLENKGVKKQLKELFKSNKELVKKVGDQKEILFTDETFEAFFKEYNNSQS
jgi:hypothetical protein